MNPGAIAEFQDIQVDCREVVHHCGIVLTSKDATRATHIRGKLIDFIDTLDHVACDVPVREFPKDNLVGGSVCKLMDLSIGTANPVAISFQSLY